MTRSAVATAYLFEFYDQARAAIFCMPSMGCCKFFQYLICISDDEYFEFEYD